MRESLNDDKKWLDEKAVEPLSPEDIKGMEDVAAAGGGRRRISEIIQEQMQEER